MSSTIQKQQDEIDLFWDKYIRFTIKQGVKESVVRWYVLRAEQYIKANFDKRLAEHKPDDVTRYLKGISKNTPFSISN